MLDQPYNADIAVKAKCALQSIPYPTLFKKKKVLFSTILKSFQNEKQVQDHATRLREQVTRESEVAIPQSIDIIHQYVQSWSK